MRATSVPFSPARPSRLKKRAGDLARGVHPLLDIHRQREEVDVAQVARGGGGRGRACRRRRRRRSRRPAWPACRSRRRSQFRRPRRTPESLQAYVPFLRPLLVSGPSASFDASVVVASRIAALGTPAAMTSRIVVFGATGYTGRLVAERLAAQGARPVLAGRDERRLGELAERLGGLETVKADAMRRNSVFAAVEPGDVLVSTVGPFAKWGDAAVRAAIAAPGAVYLDSTGEPVFIRRVFEELGGRRPARAGSTLMTAMGFDFVPGRAGGRAGAARGRARRGARRRRLLLARHGRRRRQRGHARVARRRDAQRQPRLPRRRACARCARPSACARSTVKGKERTRDLGRRRRALHAPARPPRAARGQRLPGLVRRRWPSRCRRARWPGPSRSSCRACAACCRRRASGSSRSRARPRPGTTPGHAVVDRRRRLRRGRRAARRGPPDRHRRLRLHRLLHGLGRAARRRRQPARTRSAPSGRSRRSASTRSSRAAPAGRRLRAGLRTPRTVSARARVSSPDTPEQRRARPARSGAARRRRSRSNGGLAGRWNSFQRTRSSARAAANARGSRSGQTSQRGARRARRVEDPVDRPPRRLVGGLHRRQVGVRAHVVRGQEQVRDPRDARRAGRPTSRRC